MEIVNFNNIYDLNSIIGIRCFIMNPSWHMNNNIIFTNADYRMVHVCNTMHSPYDMQAWLWLDKTQTSIVVLFIYNVKNFPYGYQKPYFS